MDGEESEAFSYFKVLIMRGSSFMFSSLSLHLFNTRVSRGSKTCDEGSLMHYWCWACLFYHYLYSSSFFSWNLCLRIQICRALLLVSVWLLPSSHLFCHTWPTGPAALQALRHRFCLHMRDEEVLNFANQMVQTGFPSPVLTFFRWKKVRTIGEVFNMIITNAWQTVTFISP